MKGTEYTVFSQENRSFNNHCKILDKIYQSVVKSGIFIAAAVLDSIISVCDSKELSNVNEMG